MSQPNLPGSTANAEPQGPPLPRWAYRIVNPAMSTVLRSPLHGLMSNALMILIYDGRKSGKRYTIPVGYLQEGNTLYVFSHSTWAKNFIGGAPVAVRLRGQLVRGTARVTEDPQVISRIVQLMVQERGAEMAQRMGFQTHAANGQSQVQTPSGTTFITIELDRREG